MLAMVDSMGGSGGTSPNLYTVVRKSPITKDEGVAHRSLNGHRRHR